MYTIKNIILILLGAFLFTVAYRDIVYSEFKTRNSQKRHLTKQRYNAFWDTRYPLLCVVLFSLSFIINGIELGFIRVVSMFFSTALIIMIYFPILYFCLKQLRTHFWSRTAALLWSAPIVSLLIYYVRFWDNAAFGSLVRIDLPIQVLAVLFGIWFVGFAGVLGYYVIQHFRFKSEILRNSQEIDDLLVLDQLYEVSGELGYSNKKLKVYYDPELHTPLAFMNTIVLPSLEYSNEELYLIFKHELIHISRGDPIHKFYIGFFKAICWFNPFVWKCLRKSEEDMELSCDEAVVSECDEAEKRKYASLILNTVGDERGFTTCLSASGEALKYRLSHILTHSKKKSGMPVLFFFTLMILFSSTILTIGISGKKLEDTLWNHVQHIEYVFDNQHHYYYFVLSDEAEKKKIESVMDYLDSLELSRIENFDTSSQKIILDIYGKDTNTEYSLIVYDHMITIDDQTYSFMHENKEYYYVKESIDEKYIESLLA